MMQVGDISECNERYSVHRRVAVMHVRDIMIHMGQYHECIRGCSGSQYKSKAFINLVPHMNRDIP